MNQTATKTPIQSLDATLLREAPASVGARSIVYRSSGHRQGNLGLVGPAGLEPATKTL
jgi:hypothetical protein